METNQTVDEAPELEYLMEFSARLQSPIVEVGVGPFGKRQVYTEAGGTFEGPRLKGKVLPGGGDAAMVDRSGVLRLDLRFTLETDDGAFIFVQGNGVWRSNPSRSQKPEGQANDYGDMYIMITPRFETGDERYQWLNEIVCVAEGKMNPVADEGYLADVSYRVYAVVND